MKIIKKIDDLKIVDKERPIALIPTMGNLHAGHLSLVEQSKNLKLTSLVTIFVNPLQFGPNEDFETYPRTIFQDEENLEKENCDFLFLPWDGSGSTNVSHGPKHNFDCYGSSNVQ